MKPPTEAALVPNGPGIHEFGVSVQLVGNHFPTTDESFQDRGFGIVRQQLPAPNWPGNDLRCPWLFPPRRFGVEQPKARKLRDRRDPEKGVRVPNIPGTASSLRNRSVMLANQFQNPAERYVNLCTVGKSVAGCVGLAG